MSVLTLHVAWHRAAPKITVCSHFLRGNASCLNARLRLIYTECISLHCGGATLIKEATLNRLGVFVVLPDALCCDATQRCTAFCVVFAAICRMDDIAKVSSHGMSCMILCNATHCNVSDVNDLLGLHLVEVERVNEQFVLDNVCSLSSLSSASCL